MVLTIQNKLAIKLFGSETSKELLFILDEGYKHLRWEVNKNRINWDMYKFIINYTSCLLEEYDGEFKKEFNLYLEKLKTMGDILSYDDNFTLAIPF